MLYTHHGIGCSFAGGYADYFSDAVDEGTLLSFPFLPLLT